MKILNSILITIAVLLMFVIMGIVFTASTAVQIHTPVTAAQSNVLVFLDKAKVSITLESEVAHVQFIETGKTYAFNSDLYSIFLDDDELMASSMLDYAQLEETIQLRGTDGCQEFQLLFNTYMTDIISLQCITQRFTPTI